MILFYSDQHLRDFGSFPPFNKEGDYGLTKELLNTVKGFFWIAQLIKKHKPKLVINCGDVFHNNEYISIRTLHGASIAFEAIAQACSEVGCRHIILAGNHDIYSQGQNFENTITSLSTLKSYGEIKTKPCQIELEDFKIGIIPYTHSKNDAFLALTRLDQESNLLVTHLDFEGAIYENGKRSEGKIQPHFQNQVISGHIHTPHQIGDVNYVGSLVMHRFSSQKLDKVGGVLTYDKDTKEIQRIANPISQHYARVDLDEILEAGKEIPYKPQSVVLQAFSDKDPEDLKEILDEYDHVLISKKSSSNEISEESIRHRIDDPKSILRDYVKNERESAVKIFDETLRDSYAD